MSIIDLARGFRKGQANREDIEESKKVLGQLTEMADEDELI